MITSQTKEKCRRDYLAGSRLIARFRLFAERWFQKTAWLDLFFGQGVPPRVLCAVLAAAIAANGLTLFLSHKEITLWGVILRGVGLGVALLGLCGRSDWESLRESSLLMRLFRAAPPIQGWEKRVRVIQACRICGNPDLRPVMDLGSQCLAGLFDDGRPQNQLTTPIPLEVVCCDPSSPHGCGFIQLRHSVPSDVMFRDYGYRSGLNDAMRRHLEELSAEIESRMGLKSGDIVVDIGANDGTTLLAYREPGLVRLGFEPSDAAADAERRGIRILRTFFGSKTGARDFQKECPGRKAKVVTSVAMFYDLEDPAGFCRQIHQILDEDGLWIVELHYWGSLLETNGFDAICHEHLGYYSLYAIHRLAESCGFRLADVRFNSSNGGSMRCMFRKASSRIRSDSESRQEIARVLADEKRAAVHSPERFARFRANTEKIRSGTRDLVRQATRQGKSVYGYGASTKGNVLLQYCGFGPGDLVAIADRNPAKWGRRTPGTSIPICSEDQVRQARPDFLLILPWHFLEGFLEREKELRGGGTRFIVPFPEARIV